MTGCSSTNTNPTVDPEAQAAARDGLLAKYKGELAVNDWTKADRETWERLHNAGQ
jgi:hypothetical protein